MATGKKTGGRNFAKGNKGRPKGSVVIPKEIRNINALLVESVFSKYLKMNIKELQEIIKNKEVPSLDLIAIKIISEAIKKGDYTRLNFLLDRTIGRVKEVVDIATTQPINIHITSDDAKL